MIKIYGIKNCDSVKKALRFFKNHNIEYELIDFKADPVGCKTIHAWLEKNNDLKTLFNTRGTTYRTLKLKDLDLNDDAKVEWLCKENMLIKRPVVDDGKNITYAFNEEIYKERFL